MQGIGLVVNDTTTRNSGWPDGGMLDCASLVRWLGLVCLLVGWMDGWLDGSIDRSIEARLLLLVDMSGTMGMPMAPVVVN